MPQTCPQCQSQAGDDASACPSCGASLSTVSGVEEGISYVDHIRRLFAVLWRMRATIKETEVGERWHRSARRRKG